MKVPLLSLIANTHTTSYILSLASLGEHDFVTIQFIRYLYLGGKRQ